jgi:hypothetical protein
VATKHATADIQRELSAWHNALPHGAARVLHDGPDPAIDDYEVLWSLKLEPANTAACPLEISVVNGEAETLAGFACDSWERIAHRLDLRLTWGGKPFFVGFGAEPSLPLEQVLVLADAIVAGTVQLQVDTFRGALVGTSGCVSLGNAARRYPGVVVLPLVPSFLGQRKLVQYQPWASPGESPR